jgi:hypothetical protein
MSVRVFPAGLAVLLLSACSNDPVMRLETRPADPLPVTQDRARIGAADLADGATTAIGLAQPGIVEANPLFAWAGPAAPVVGIAGKYAVKTVLIENGMAPAAANRAVETGSAFAACANVATIAGAAAPPALALGIACGALYSEATKAASAPTADAPRVRAVAVPFEALPAD